MKSILKALSAVALTGVMVLPVLADDTEESLAARVLEVEHRIYPEALRLVAEGRVRFAK